jgi:hypothetical protein
VELLVRVSHGEVLNRESLSGYSLASKRVRRKKKGGTNDEDARDSKHDGPVDDVANRLKATSTARVVLEVHLLRTAVAVVEEKVGARIKDGIDGGTEDREGEGGDGGVELEDGEDTEFVEEEKKEAAKEEENLASPANKPATIRRD